MMMRRLHLALLTAVLVLASAPARGAAPATVSGVVRDSAGIPQIGAQVQLLRPDLTVIAIVYTNSAGRFAIASVTPGRYAVKAMGESFLPALREDVRVRTGAVVNLTLNTLYEAMQWLPAEPRAKNAGPDDWKWTLRTAANRPLLRMLEDGPLVVVSDGAGGSPKLKARLVATRQEGSFGESGERVSAAMEETPINSRELLAQVDFDPVSTAALESTLGFRQDLGFAGAVESVAALAIHPEIEGADGAGQMSSGLDEAAVQTEESIRMGDEFEGEVGATETLARFGQNSPNTVIAALPFAMAGWHAGNSTIRYRMTTAAPASASGDDASAQAWLPRVAMRNGQLVMEHGLHQELGWERRTDGSMMSVSFYSDRVSVPVIEGFASGQAAAVASPALLLDSASGLLRAAGPAYSAAGVVAAMEHQLGRQAQLRLSYASGSALTMAPTAQTAGRGMNPAQLAVAAHKRSAQSCSLSLSGTLEGTGTRWRATYRWQPEDTVTQVATFAQDATDPYLSLQLRQPLYRHKDGSGGLEVLVNVRNLLAEGYQPYVLSDGSVLVFAQAERGASGGLAFSF